MEVTDSSGPSTSGVTVTSSSNAENIATGSPGNDGLTVTSIPVQPGTSSSNDESVTGTNGSLLSKSTITIPSEPND